MAAGPHPFPFRTRKLSPPAPMVLGTCVPGRVGRRRISFSSSGALGPRSSAFGVHPVVGRVGTVNHPKGQPPRGTDGPRNRGSGARQPSGRGKPPGSSKGRDNVTEPPRDWGGVTRRGAGHLARVDREDRRPRAGRTAERAQRAAERSQRPTSPVREHADRLHAEAVEAVSRGGQVVRSRRPSKAHNREPLPRAPRRLPDSDTIFRRVLGDGPGGRAAARLREAARAFEDERFGEARRILNPLVERVPHVAEVVELLEIGRASCRERV